MGAGSNWLSAWPSSEISVTRKRLKWADTSGNPASMAVVTGSSTVFEDGVNMPIRVRWPMTILSSLDRAHRDPAHEEALQQQEQDD